MQHLARIACALAVAPIMGAHAQSQAPAQPHVPAQILAAKRAFVSNAGSDTYGAETYFRLTKYAGGPNRFYDAYYNALKTWGRYELVETPADADIVLQIRFANPIVDRQESASVADVNTGFVTSTSTAVHDPQLDLTVVDPKTHVTLWNLAEHIQPAKNQSANDANFDQAVARLVTDTKTLANATPQLLAGGQSPLSVGTVPPGATEVARHDERLRHLGIGLGTGSLVGLAMMVRSGQGCNSVGCAESSTLRDGLEFGLSSMVVGGLVGWLWPTHQ